MNIPRHIALIMDGNRRWARRKFLPQFEGHRRGEEAIEPIINRAIKVGITHLTFWAFSTENWNREKSEVDFLLNLYRYKLDKEVNNFHKKNVKLNVIGNLEKFPRDLISKTKDWMNKTKNNTAITVNMALGYGGRDEIIRAVNKWKLDTKSKSNLTKEEFNKYLDTANQPDPDLLIRTGGDSRLSGFLLWQSEYSELYFTDVFWPDFTPEEFDKALLFFDSRQRRFGK